MGTEHLKTPLFSICSTSKNHFISIRVLLEISLISNMRIVGFCHVFIISYYYFQLHLNDLDTFYMLLSVQYGVELHERESIIIFDEVQLFPKAREAIKYLVADGRYDFIETGSLISIKENVKDIVIPSEERHIKMYPLDFEEFCLNTFGIVLLKSFHLSAAFTKRQCYFLSNTFWLAECQ